jgi:hypothetical protein
MFNLLVKFSGWAESRDSIPIGRILEYTDQALVDRFRPSGRIDYYALSRLPAVFMQENADNRADQIVRIGSVFRATPSGTDVILEYVADPSIPPFSNEDFEALANDLGIGDWEFSRTHWAVKDADLFQALVRHMAPRRLKPRVFMISDPERIEPLLVSVMMPFHPGFDEVYRVLGETVERAGLKCRRADDIWENPAVMQDVVSLIDRSRVVICDCTGRNPNVFYEIGIAHTLGREVILITQSQEDIPFDLRHLRYVPYLNNGEGRKELQRRVEARLANLVGG